MNLQPVAIPKFMLVALLILSNKTQAQLCRAALQQQLHIEVLKTPSALAVHDTTRYHPRTGERLIQANTITVNSPGYGIQCYTPPIRFIHDPFYPMNTKISGEDLKHTAEQ